jgi:hypothetical protein
MKKESHFLENQNSYNQIYEECTYENENVFEYGELQQFPEEIADYYFEIGM